MINTTYILLCFPNKFCNLTSWLPKIHDSCKIELRYYQVSIVKILKTNTKLTIKQSASWKHILCDSSCLENCKQKIKNNQYSAGNRKYKSSEKI